MRSASILVVFALTPVWVSLGQALTNPGYGSSFGTRLAEWTRLNGGGSIVSLGENLWYSHHQPPIGGRPAPGAIPAPPAKAAPPVAHSALTLAAPAPVTPFASPSISGEGDWHSVGRKVDGQTAIYETFMRPDAVHTSTVVGIAWMDTKLLRASLYSGSQIPGGGPYPLTAPVQPGAARTLVAAFNAGFLMSDANGGYYTGGHVIFPLRTGAGSFIIYRNGTATVGAWRGSSELTSNVVAVRQNLDLLVRNAHPVPGLQANDTSKWGATLENQIYVWRSGIGVTADGALVYVGGPGLNITSLAHLLVRVGAVTAIEFDINTDWVDFASFRPSTANGLASAANGTDLLSSMASPGRYFASWWVRDFITMSARNPRG
ncbi:MAG: phosphodiester glycosidase family protein [Acidimicrobiales bacterium]